MSMSAGLSAVGALDRHFLEVRGRILELAAIFDRLDRGTGADGVQEDPRLRQLHEGVAGTGTGGADPDAVQRRIHSELEVGRQEVSEYNENPL